jgi:hypothetical protein
MDRYEKLLYFEAVNHILTLFTNINNIDDSQYYRKLINIGVSGKWDVDVITCFQIVLQEKVFAKPELTFNLLEKKTDEEIKSFFYFFFDSVHPNWKGVPKEFQKLKKSNTRVYGLMKVSYDAVMLSVKGKNKTCH